MKYFLILPLIFFSWSLNAQEPQRYSLPQPPTVVKDRNEITCSQGGNNFSCMQDGVEYKLVSVEQWQTILLMANAYKGLYDWRLKIEGVLSANESVINSYELLLKGKDREIDIYKERVEYLDLRLKQSNELIEDKTLKATLERSILWGVILAETITMCVIGVKGATSTF